MIDLEVKDFDLVLAADSDLSTTREKTTIIKNQVIEHFDMQFGDDIDFPELYSEQRSFTNSNSETDKLARAQDAERILSENPLIDNSTVNAEINEFDTLETHYKLKNEEKINGFVMK